MLQYWAVKSRCFNMHTLAVGMGKTCACYFLSHWSSHPATNPWWLLWMCTWPSWQEWILLPTYKEVEFQEILFIFQRAKQHSSLLCACKLFSLVTSSVAKLFSQHGCSAGFKSFIFMVTRCTVASGKARSCCLQTYSEFAVCTPCWLRLKSEWNCDDGDGSSSGSCFHPRKQNKWQNAASFQRQLQWFNHLL